MLPATRVLIALLCAMAVPNLWSATYYVASSGDDSNAGDAPERAWKSAAKISASRFQPGDRILLKAGDTFHGQIQLTKEDSGTPEAAVEISKFGEGRALIVGGKQTALWAADVENLLIRNLVLVGDGPTVNEGYGVLVENTQTNRMLTGLVIDSVEINGFGKHGMLVTGTRYGYENVTISRCSFRENLRGGLEVAGKLAWDEKIYAHKNVTVSECRAYDNPGDPKYTKNHSGSGLVLYQVDGGKIEKCAAWNNGEFCPAAGGGPVGIWTCASRRVVIEYCESFGNRTQGMDGGGFDIDGGSEECVLQYNYSHDNDGPGLMVYTYPYASYRDRSNVVRFNISVNDSRRGDRYAGLWIRADGRKLEGVDVYNNTIITKGKQAAFIHSDGVQVNLRNNIFLSGQDGVPLRVDGTNLAGVKLDHNLYWRGGAPFLVRWGHKDVASMEALQVELNQERAGEHKLGSFSDPKISVNSSGISQPLPSLRLLAQFTPVPFARNRGRPLGSLVDGPIEDFLGNQLKPDGTAPFGAIGGL